MERVGGYRRGYGERLGMGQNGRGGRCDPVGRMEDTGSRLNYDHWPERYSTRDSKLPRRICVGYPSIVSAKGEDNQKGGRERRAGPKVTYTLIPVIPEFVEPLVETNGESEGASEDAGNEDACQAKCEFFQNMVRVVVGSVVLFRRAMRL